MYRLFKTHDIRKAYEADALWDFEDVRDYSPENPVLYTLKSELYQGENAIDDLIEKVGFREIKTEGKKLSYATVKKHFISKPLYICEL